jgi:hypothetical protein
MRIGAGMPPGNRYADCRDRHRSLAAYVNLSAECRTSCKERSMYW